MRRADVSQAAPSPAGTADIRQRPVSITGGYVVVGGGGGGMAPRATPHGRILRVRGRGVPKRGGGAGDLLVTVK